MAGAGLYGDISCQVDKLSQVPVGDWIGDWTSDVTGTVRASVERGEADHKMPLLVGYNIPNRDLGQSSAGGAESHQQYLDFVAQFSAGLGDKPAVVVWEPDAVAQAAALAPDEIAARFDLLRQALQMFHDNNPNAVIYLDAGNDAWRSPEQTAELLRQVDGGTGLVTNIALNVSNYGTTEANEKYGRKIADVFGRPLRQLIDVSRNGARVHDRSDFCNNSEARIGQFALSSYRSEADVVTVFVKQPGRSDGNGPGCDPAFAPAGQFDARLLMTQLNIPTSPYAD
jgi:endoglucanase